MKIHLIYNDSFLQGSNFLIKEILLKYKLEIIDLNEIYREAVIAKSINEIDVNSVSDVKLSLLTTKLAETQNRNFLIAGFNFDSNQVQVIFSELSKYNCTLESIWYFQVINVLENLKKVEKYKIMAEREDATFAHINKAITDSQFANINMIKLINKYDKLCIYNVEAYGEEGKYSIESVIKQIKTT